MNQQELELLWAYQQEDMAADRIANEIRRSPTRQKLEKNRNFIIEQQKRFKQIEEQVSILADRVDAIKDAIARCEEQIKGITSRFEAQPPTDLEAARSMLAEISKHRETIGSYEQEMRRIVKDTSDYDNKQRSIRHEAAKAKQEFDQLKVGYDQELKTQKAALDAQRAVAASKKAGISPELLEEYKGKDQACLFARSATVGKALSVLANASYNYPETEIAEAVKALRSGTTADAVYWFKSAMASYPRQMERFFGDRYAAAARLYYAMQGTLNVADDSELPTYDAKQLLKTYKNDAILIFTDEASAVQTEGSLAAELQTQLDKQKYDEGEDHDKVCAIATIYGTWSNAGNFTPDDAETAWDADSLTEALGSDALRGKDMLLALDGEDSPYLTENCLLKDTETPVAEQVQKLFVLDKNNMASPESAESE